LDKEATEKNVMDLAADDAPVLLPDIESTEKNVMDLAADDDSSYKVA